MFAVAPENLASCSVQGNDRAACSCRGVEHSTYHQGCGFEAIFRRRPEVICLESPSQLKLIEVAGIDLLEGRIACVAEVTTVGGPLGICRYRLRCWWGAGGFYRAEVVRQVLDDVLKVRLAAAGSAAAHGLNRALPTSVSSPGLGGNIQRMARAADTFERFFARSLRQLLRCA